MFAWLWPRSKDKPRGEPPKFLVPLQPQKVKHGEKVVLETSVRGLPTPRVIWYHLDKEVVPSPEFVQEHDTTTGRVVLNINEVFIDDKGLYRCLAVNEFGRDETASYVTVEDIEVLEKCELRQAPRITLPLQPQILKKHSSLDLLARYEAFPPPTVKWYHQGKELKPSRDYKIETIEDETSLHVEEVFEDDYGEYEVRIFNEAGEARTVASVIITQPLEVVEMEPPKFIKPLHPQIVPEGEVAILEAEVTAKPEAEFKWYRHGQEITHDEEIEVQITSNNNKSSLVLGELFEDDSGDYTVTAQNPVGRASSTATLLVEGEGDEEAEPPSFDPPLTPIRVMDGEEVRFRCKVTGKPMPKLTWLQNGRPIAHHREVRLTQTPDGKAGLQILEVFPEDAGDYTCIARNKAGEARTTANLAVESYEYVPDSEAATTTSVSEKNIFSGPVSEEEETIEIEKDTDSDNSEAGSAPYFCNRLEQKIEVVEGTSVRLLVKVTGYPRPTIKWHTDGVSVEVTETRTVETYEDGTSALTLHKTTLEDCGEYVCEAMNRNGVDTTVTTLVVLPEHTEGTSTSYRKPEWVTRMEELKEAMSGEQHRPQFTKEITNSRVKEMETITFTAHFRGNPKPDITWYHNSKIIRQQQCYQMRIRNDKAMLTIVEARPEFRGEYSCRAANSEGEVFTRAHLDVIELTYEEKLKVSNERYAAVNIQHAAEHMKEKERERALKQKKEHEEAMARLKQDKVNRQAQRQQELEDAKKNVWKPKVVEEVKEVKKSPKEHCVAELYSNWKSAVSFEDNYPELEPNEFAPNQIPGVKCFVKVSETSIKGEEVVREVAPQFFQDEQIIHELAKVHTLLKNNVRVNEIWSMFRAGEFKALQQPNIQSALVKVCEYIGHQRNVSIVLAEEIQEQAKKHPVGLKAFLRMLKYAKNVKPDTLFKDVIPREMGKWSSTTQELTEVSQMLNKGIQTEEIIASCVAGKLPTLKKPETQQPLVNIVEKHGHSVMVAQVLVEEAYRDAKDERVLAEQAWEVIHEQEMKMAEVSEVRTERPETAPAAPKPVQQQATQQVTQQVTQQMTQQVTQQVTQQGTQKVTKVVTQEFTEPEKTTTMIVQKVSPQVIQETTQQITQPIQQQIIKKTVVQETHTEQPKEKVTVQKVTTVAEPQPALQTTEETIVMKQPKMTQQTAKVSEQTQVMQKVSVQKTQILQQEKVTEEKPLITQEVQEVKKPKVVAEKAMIVEEPKVLKKTTVIQQPTLVQQEVMTAEKPEEIKEVTTRMKTTKAEIIQEPEVLQTTVVRKPVVVQKEMVVVQEPETTVEVSSERKVTEKAEISLEPKILQKTIVTQQPTQVVSYEEMTKQESIAPFSEKEKLQPSHEQRITVHKETILEKPKEQIVPTMQHEKQVVVEQKQVQQTVQKTAVQQEQQMTVQMQKSQQVTQQVQQTQQVKQKVQQTQQVAQQVQQTQQVTVQKQQTVQQKTQQKVVTQEQLITEQQKPVPTPQLPKVDVASVTSVESLQSASASQVEVRAYELAPPLQVKFNDQLRATATYVCETDQQNAMHLVEGERVYVQESTNSDWWFVKKHLTLEQGYVPAKLLAEETSYTHYVQQKLAEKISKLPVFDKLKKGQKAEPPTIVTKIQPSTIADGKEAQFVCKVQGTPRPTITWFRQTAIIKPSDEFQVFYSDDNTATLVIKEVFPEDAGMFTCVAKNEFGYSSCSAELVVEGPISDHGSESMMASRRSLSRESSVCDYLEGIPPTFADKPKIKTVEEGAQLEMDVRLVAIPEPEITWKKNGQVIRDSQHLRIVKQKDVHAYRSIIIIKGVRKEDEGQYEVIVKNREGEARNQITLKVTAPQGPAFQEKFGDQTVEAEGTIRLVAKIRGVPAPDVTWSSTFKRGLESCVVDENSEVILECRTSKEKRCTWYKDNTELKSSRTMHIEQEGLTHRLVIQSATMTDSGKYSCKFDNQSTFCNLTVKGVDDFVERIQDVEVQEREQAILQVEVSSEKATVTWHKDGEEITSKTNRFKLVSEGKRRKLILISATLADEGEYTCVLGDQECTAELTVRELPAEIVKKMKDQVVSKGSRATMEVELTKGDAVITWYKDGKEIRFSDHYQLSIDGKIQRLMVYNCQLEDSGVYRAVVGKSECSASLKVELQAEGDFSKRLPAQMDVNYKADATFVVEVTKEYDVKWYRNTEEIVKSDKYIMKKEGMKRILIVKSVTQVDAFEYSCILGSLKTSCRLNVVLMETAPKIEKKHQKAEIVVTKGKDATLTVPFTATPVPKISLYYKGQLVETAKSQKILPTISENVANITIKQIENIDCGEYRLKLSNDCGDAYAEFTVKILDKPSSPGCPEPMKVTNDSVTLHWTIPQEDGGRVIINYIIEYRTKREEKWIVYNKDYKVTESTVVVQHLTKDEEYSFRVSAVNEIGTSEVSRSCEFVKVSEPVRAEPPMVKEQLQAVVSGLHQEVILRCVVTATPAPKIEWLKDGKAISGFTKYENFTATFTIKQTNEDSGGMYTCRASNEAGMAECSATVVIQEAPRFDYDEKQQCQRLHVGEKWHVPIQVIGYPRPRIIWSRNDQPLMSSQRIVIHTEESEGMTDIAIQKLSMEDSAVYTLTAENSAGRSQLSFNLRVVEEERESQVCALEVIEEEVKRERPAPPMGPLRVSEVTSSSLRLTWEASPYDGGMEITSYYIEKLEKTQKHWQKVAEVGASVRTYVVTELVEGHEYMFRVFAVNALGISDSLEVSETILIKSPFDKPGPPIGPFDVNNITESSILLHWDEPDSDGGSPITHYILEKRESTKKAWTKVGQTLADVTQMEVTGLKRGVGYCFRVFAFNAVGQGPPLQPEEPITAGKKITPPSKPNSLQVIDVTTKTVTLAWAPPTTTGGADLMGYVIERRLISEKKWERVDTVDASVTLYCVENLQEKSEYEFRVFAENPVGLSLEAAMTEQVRLKTHAMPPSPPTAPLEVRPTGPNSLMIEWGAPESDGGAPLLGYIIAIRDIKRTMWIEVGQVGANFTRLHIKELQEEHEYHVRVFARNEVGTSDPLETEDPVKVIRPADFTELPEDDNAPSLSYSTTETLSWMREAGMDADIYSYARGRLLNRDEYFFKVWHRGMDKYEEKK